MDEEDILTNLIGWPHVQAYKAVHAYEGDLLCLGIRIARLILESVPPHLRTVQHQLIGDGLNLIWDYNEKKTDFWGAINLFLTWLSLEEPNLSLTTAIRLCIGCDTDLVLTRNDLCSAVTIMDDEWHSPRFLARVLELFVEPD